MDMEKITVQATMGASGTRRRILGLAAAGIAAPLAATLGLGANDAHAAVATPATGGEGAPAVLVHGSFLGGWCWDEVIPSLETAGRAVSAPDLPGHGADTTPIPDITLESYVARVLEAIDAQPAPVVLVGHSMGGIVISEVAERRPEAVKALVYLGAYLLEDGVAMLDAALSDGDSLLGPRFQADQAAGVGTVPPEVFAAAFFHDCPPETVAAAMPLVRPEPLAPLATPIRVSAENFGRVPRNYAETLLDRVVSPSLQRRMQADVPGSHVVSLATGHAPFFAQPGQLASLIALI